MIVPNLYYICKKVLAFAVAFMLFIKIFVIDVYALSAAPVFGEALVEVFSGLLVASGAYTSEEVNNMSWFDAEAAIDEGITSGTINPVEVVGDVTVNGVTKKMNFLEWLATISKVSTDVVTSETFGTIVDNSVKTTLNNYVPLTIGNWITTSVDKEDVIDTPATDMNGYGAKIVSTRKSDGQVRYIYCDYAVYNERYGVYSVYGAGYIETIEADGTITYTHFTDNGSSVSISSTFPLNNYYDRQVYGDCRTSAGTPADTDDTYTDVVGEDYDGDLISLEDIQSGAIPLDDTTLDYDKFNDDAIVDLLQQILAELEQVPVVEEDTTETVDSAKDTVSDMAAELDIADLNNLQMPLGIADVFPFCLPFDFVRGMELLVAKPEVPVFKTIVDFGEINGWDLGEYPVEISFEKWGPVAIVTRWTSLLLFSYVLIFISTKIVKGAGA